MQNYKICDIFPLISRHNEHVLIEYDSWRIDFKTAHTNSWLHMIFVMVDVHDSC